MNQCTMKLANICIGLIKGLIEKLYSPNSLMNFRSFYIFRDGNQIADSYSCLLLALFF